ncbi:hypothetical protein VZG28_06320 [Synechococcus elongatus IITB4]|uniref:hypothetical protein n=1 Tax=Synechococcus elongatus TaxID=32046 RepID=UPI0030D579F5
MSFFPLPVIGVVANQDIGFQIIFSLMVFVLLNSCVWQSSVIAAANSQVLWADPEEDYLPRALQKRGPTPTEMEAFFTGSMANPERPLDD